MLALDTCQEVHLGVSKNNNIYIKKKKTLLILQCCHFECLNSGLLLGGKCKIEVLAIVASEGLRAESGGWA